MTSTKPSLKKKEVALHETLSVLSRLFNLVQFVKSWNYAFSRRSRAVTAKKCTKKGDALATRVVLPIKTFCFNLISGPIGPLQLAIHVVQNRHVGEQKSHRDKTNKRHT